MDKKIQDFVALESVGHYFIDKVTYEHNNYLAKRLNKITKELENTEVDCLCVYYDKECEINLSDNIWFENETIDCDDAYTYQFLHEVINLFEPHGKGENSNGCYFYYVLPVYWIVQLEDKTTIEEFLEKNLNTEFY